MNGNGCTSRAMTEFSVTPSDTFTKEMVQRTIKYFSDPASVDQRDHEAMRVFLSDFVKFERLVERGLVAADARQLAMDFVVYARAWIKEHQLEPSYQDLKR